MVDRGKGEGGLRTMEPGMSLVSLPIGDVGPDLSVDCVEEREGLVAECLKRSPVALL